MRKNLKLIKNVFASEKHFNFVVNIHCNQKNVNTFLKKPPTCIIKSNL